MQRTVATSGAAVMRSISLSGAGFLGAYHVGAVAALQRANYLPDYSNTSTGQGSETSSRADNQPPPMFLGSSAGSLVSAGIVTGQPIDEIMAICHELSAQSREQPLDFATPGFDLMDALEPFLRSHLERASQEALDRASSGMLRLYLTHFHAFKDGWRLGTVDGLSQHARYLDSFVNVDHLVGALILSSYIPGGTGRINPPVDSAVGRARAALEAYGRVKVADFPPVGLAKEWGDRDTGGGAGGAGAGGEEEGQSSGGSEGLKEKVKEEMKEVKASMPHNTAQPRPSLVGTAAAAAASRAALAVSEEAAVVARLIDGGLGANWPALDANTVLVSPLAIKPLGARNAARHVICPRGDWKRPLSLPAHEVMVDASADTLRRIPLMMLSSPPAKLDAFFAEGFDDANRFLKEITP